MAEPKGKLVTPVGFRDDATIHALELTDDDELKVALSTATGSDLLTELLAKLETADLELVSKILSIGAHGWLGGAWQRQAMPFGFSGRVIRNWENASVAAGTVTLSDIVVPAGEYWVITQIVAFVISASASALAALIFAAGPNIHIFHQLVPVTATIYDRQGWWLMAPGDNLSVRIYGATLGDGLYGRALGFRIDIDQ